MDLRFSPSERIVVFTETDAMVQGRTPLQREVDEDGRSIHRSHVVLRNHACNRGLRCGYRLSCTKKFLPTQHEAPIYTELADGQRTKAKHFSD